MGLYRRFDRVVLDAGKALRRESDGALVVPGRFARTGLQTYQNEDGSPRIEYRSKDVVLASAHTFEGITVTDDHPADFVGPSNWRLLAHGHVQNVRTVDDDETWLEADFVISSGALADAIERKERKELSAGYYCDFIEGAVEYRGQHADGQQSGIVGNHVATLREGEARAGRGARMMIDSAGHEILPVGERKDIAMKFTVRVDGVDYEIEAPTQALAQAIAKERAQHEEAIAAERARADEADKRASKAEAELAASTKALDGVKAELNDARDPARRARDAAELQELTEKAQIVAGKKIDATGTPHEIRMAALKAGGEDVMESIPADRKEDSTYVEAFTAARFDAACASRKDARSSVVGNTRAATAEDPIIAALERNDAARASRSRQLRGLSVERS